MSREAYEQGNPWRDESQVFRAVGVIILLVCGGLALYDGPRFYRKQLNRCRATPSLPECGFLNIPERPAPPQLGIVLDQGSGKWAIQLAAMDQQTANNTLTRLTAAGATARLIKNTGRRNTSVYFIQLGRFKTQKDARDAARQLNSRGLVNEFIVTSYHAASQ
jgi:hypothetical protein